MKTNKGMARKLRFVGAAAVLLVAATAAWWSMRPAVGHGMTWGVVEDLGSISQQVVHLDCNAGGKLDQPLDGKCNTEKGDTSCRASLPLLCTLPAQPGAPIVESGPLKGWAKTSVGATLRVAGSALTSAQAADGKCRADLGEGWRASQLFAGGQPSVHAVRDKSLEGATAGTRYWVVAADAAANCWNSAR